MRDVTLDENVLLGSFTEKRLTTVPFYDPADVRISTETQTQVEYNREKPSSVLPIFADGFAGIYRKSFLSILCWYI